MPRVPHCAWRMISSQGFLLHTIQQELYKRWRGNDILGGKTLWIKEQRSDIRSVKFITISRLTLPSIPNYTKDISPPSILTGLKTPQRKRPCLLHFNIVHLKIWLKCTFWFGSSGWDLRLWISNKLPGAAEAGGPRPHLEEEGFTSF